MRPRTTFARVAASALVAICVSTTTPAQFDPSTLDENLLPSTYPQQFVPEYCLYTYDGPRRLPDERYERTYGSGWIHVHHYCRAIQHFNDALKYYTDERARSIFLTSTVSECDYVLRNAPTSFILRPEILLKKGMALLILEKPTAAMNSFHEAVQLRPDYVPAYVAMSNQLLKIGQPEQAEKLLQTALQHAPESKILKERLQSIGSTEPSNQP